MTLAQMLRESVKKYGQKSALVTMGKDAIDWSYNELYQRTEQYAAVLASKGLKRGDHVSVISENCPEFAVLDWACHALGLVVVPIYTSLPKDQVHYILRDAQAKFVVCGSPELAAKAEGISQLPILLLKGTGAEVESLESLAANVDTRLIHFEDEISAGDAEAPGTIIYTSGTTGAPKGAVLSDRAFVHVCKAGKEHLQFIDRERFLNFLPMSHIYEQVAGQALPVYLGATICLSKNLSALASEMKEFKPSIMLAVPRFLENLRERILANVAKDKPIKQKLFYAYLDQGLKHSKGRFAPFYGLLDSLVGTKIRERTGGNLRFFVSGGAALEPSVAEFYISVGLNVLQGYGLTETSGGTFINKLENNKFWTVGEPLQMETRIAPDGEILIRGPGLMSGYYNLAEETASAIDSEGWFHTGDIGEFEGKNLKITDRKKDIIVLANGKNVAPQMVENRLKSSPLIAEAVVIGDRMDHCVALIVINPEAVATALGRASTLPPSQDVEVVAFVKRELDRINKTLAPYEMVKKHAILDQPFSIESGELTPTLKVKRRVVIQKFAKNIEPLTS